MSAEDSTPAFQPRYSAEESSDAAYERDELHRRWASRKDRALSIVLLVAFLTSVGVVTRVYLFFVGMRLTGNIEMLSPDDLTRRETSSVSLWSSWKKTRPDKTFSRAALDSSGFFNEISDDEWNRMKHETRTIIDMQDDVMMKTSHLLSESGANINSKLWWADNWKINFSCRDKVVFVGGKWMCDPKRLITVADEVAQMTGAPTRGRSGNNMKNAWRSCIVYISGRMDLEFGHQFLDYSLARVIELHSGQVLEKDSSPCEVHIFSPHGQSLQEFIEPRDGFFVHPWGLRPTHKENMGFVSYNITSSLVFKTLEESINLLHHTGKVSVLSLDCDACEWDMYKDIIALDEPIQQVLMQMHGSPYMANEMFLAMQESGYVIFHREEQPGGRGEVYDYSWLKLSPSFFNWRPL